MELSIAETREIILKLRKERELLKCPRTGQRAVAVNTGTDFETQPLMCAKCLINYCDPFVDRELVIYALEDFFDGLEAALDNAELHPNSPQIKLNEQNLKKLAQVFQSVCNQVHEQVEHAVEKYVQKYKTDLATTLENHCKQMTSDKQSSEIDSTLTGGDRIKALLFNGYHGLKNSPLQDTQAKLAEMTQKIDDQASEIAFSQSYEESSNPIAPVLADVTNRQLQTLTKKLQLPPVENLQRDVAFRHAFPEVRATSAEVTDFCWWISPVKMSSFYGFSMGVLSIRSTPMNVKLYEGEDKSSTVLAEFEFILPCMNKQAQSYPGQTVNTHLVRFPSPVPLTRSKWYLLSVQPLASLHGQTIVTSRNEAFAGSYVATNVGRNDKEIKVYFKMNQGLDKSGADLYNSAMPEIFVIPY